MADVHFTGQAQQNAQVDKFTPADVEIGDIFKLTATALDGTVTIISFTATAATVANVTAGLVSAWNASASSSTSACYGVTATDMTTYVKLTAATVGFRFVVSSSTVDGGGTDTQTLTREAVTLSISANDFDYPDNWDITPTAQVDTFTPTGVTAADVYTLTLTAPDGSTISISETADGAPTAIEVADGLISTWNASTDARLAAITASGTGSGTVILTADKAGLAFSVAGSVAGSGTFPRAATQANIGIPGDSTQVLQITPTATSADTELVGSTLAKKR